MVGTHWVYHGSVTGKTSRVILNIHRRIGIESKALETTEGEPGPVSERTTIRRYHWLAKYDRETVNSIIDAGFVCQVGYVIATNPM